MKLVKKLGMVAAALAFAGSVNAELAFTVDTGVSVDNPTDLNVVSGGSLFQGNQIDGSYDELIMVGPNTSGVAGTWESTFSSTIYLNHTTIKGVGFGASDYLVAAGDYDLYSMITITGNIAADLVTAAFSFGGFTGSYSVFLDSNAAGFTDTVVDAPTSLTTGVISLLNDSDDVLLGSGTISAGSGNINNGSDSFSLASQDFSVTTDGEKFFVAPNPFYINLNSTGDLSGIEDAFRNWLIAPKGVPAFSISKTASITFVPEPSTVGFLSLVLIGLGLRARMK